MKMKAVVLGMGVLGCHIAYWLAKAGVKTTIVDRSDPFEVNPIEQTSAHAIGIIEPFGLKPKALCADWYLRSRERYMEMIREGHSFVEEMDIRYYSDLDGFLDGSEGRAEEEQHCLIDPKEEGLPFQYGEYFRGILVNTTLYNFWIRQELIDSGVTFVKREIQTEPGEVRVDGETPNLIFDCRGLGLRATDAGKHLFPIAGQTILLHAPEGTTFEGIRGNPGQQMSYNVVPWMRVTKYNLECLGLAGKIDYRKGGWLVLVGASKRLNDFDWTPQTWEIPSFLAGAAVLDSRIMDWPVVMVRKGMRAKLSEGILDRRTLYGDVVVRVLAGWAGAAYCGSFAYAEDVVAQELQQQNQGTKAIWQGMSWSR